MHVIPFRYRQASAKLERLDLGIYQLKNVWSHARRMGDGRGVMERVASYADRHNLILVLVAQQYGNPNSPGLNNKQLEEFYAKFGFEKQPDQGKPTRMIRYPNQKGSTP